MDQGDELLSSFLGIKLDSGDQLAQLLARSEEEAKSGSIRLSDHVGPAPAYLTPAMSAWYGKHIAAGRKRALDYVASLFQAASDGRSSEALFIERRLDELADDRLQKKRQLRESHRGQHQASYERLQGLRTDYEKTQREYETIRARLRREPKLVDWRYLLAIAGVGVAEAFVNYESFRDIPQVTSPAIALGTTVLVALLLAGSSHCHGTLIKQLHARFGEHRRDDDIASGWWIFSMGTVGLMSALAAVWYARSYFLADAVLQAKQLGDVAPSALWIIGGSLITNVIVWIVGVMIAWWWHDEDPHFADAYSSRERAEQRYRRLQESLNKPLRREFKRIDAESDKFVAEARAQDDSLRNLVRYQEARRVFDRIAAKDKEVVGALEEYRAQLARLLADKAQPFEVPEKLDRDQAVVLGTSQFCAEPLRLKYL